MRKNLKVALSLIVAFTMIFTMGVSSFSEVGDNGGQTNPLGSENPTQNDETVTGNVYEKDLPKTVAGDVYGVDPIKPFINASVTTDKEFYEYGDTIFYDLILKNEGNVDLENISIVDGLNGEYSLDSLDIGTTISIPKEYYISPDSNATEIVNNIYISTMLGEEKVLAETGFILRIMEEEEGFVEGELAENYPDMLGEPELVFPSMFAKRGLRTMSVSKSALEDTIAVDKTAVRSPGCRTFEVTLDITGTPQQAPVDVVLVLDRSGSMKNGVVDEYVAITSAPSTNKSYYVKINGYYQEVNYNTWYNKWVYGPFGNRAFVSWDPNGDDNSPGSNSSSNPVGKPFYETFGASRMYYAKQAAVNFAAKVLTGPDAVAGSRVSIVSYAGPTSTSDLGIQTHASTDQDLTDDINLINSAIAGLTANGGTNTQAGFIEAKSVIEDTVSLQKPNSNKVVIMFTDGMPTSSNGNSYGPNDPTSHNNHTIAAYTAAKDIYENGIADVFTVGLFEGLTGGVYNLAVDTLTQSQNKGFYDADNSQALDNIFTTIFQNLGYSATNSVVVDKIGSEFELVPGSLSAGATHSAGVITWNPGTIGTSATLSYQVRAKASFPGGDAFTNEYATLTYTDINGNTGQTQEFPKPEVNVPTLLKVELTDASMVLGNPIDLGTGTDPLDENYMSDVTGGDGDGINYTYEWRIAGEETIISTEKNPTVSPFEDTEYELTVIDSNGCRAIATMNVTVSTSYADTIGVNKTAMRAPGCRLYEVILSISGTPPIKPVDVVLVIDRSGSMQGNRISNAKTAAKIFADNVLGNGNPNNNRIAVVSYFDSATTNLGWSSDLNTVKSAINGLGTGGSTNIQSGFIKAENQIDNARAIAGKAIVLLSDGQANRRDSDPPRSYSGSHDKNTAAAYQKGEDLQAKANVFTIGLGISDGSLAQDTLKKAAQTNNYYSAPSPSQLAGIYNQISTQLNSSATNAVVVDKIGDEFELVLSTLPSGAVYDPNTREITWTPGVIGTYAELKYQIRAKSSFLGGLTDTNEYANLTYTDVNGNTGKNKVFPVPEVDVPAPLSVSLTDASVILGNSIDLGTGTSASGENYMSPISGGDGNGTFTYEWRVLGDTAVFSNDENPTVSPTVDTEYELTVIDSNGCKAIATMKVTVIKVGSIKVTKVVQDPKAEDANLEFDIFVDGPNGAQYVVTLKDGESVTLEDLPFGTYTISEIVPMNYELVSISSASITLDASNMDKETVVTNKPDNGGWFHDDDPLVNSFEVGIIVDDSNSDGTSGRQADNNLNNEKMIIKNEAILPNEEEKDQ